MNYSRAALGNQAMGYWRGSEFQYLGAGSGMGAKQAGAGVLQQGQGGLSSLAGSWHPTVLYMLGLVVAEMIAFGFLSRMLAK